MVRSASPYFVSMIAAILLSAPGSAEAQSGEQAGQVAEINQSGFQYRSDKVDFLKPGDAVIRNARLETDLVGEMALALADGTQLVMSPNSEMEIDRFVYDPDKTAGQALISLGRGALRMISGNMASRSYQLNTSVATIGVRGTDFTVELIPGEGLIVTVDEGAVEIRPLQSTTRFTILVGQVFICDLITCREAGSDDQPPRRASLGPAVPRRSGQAGGTNQRADTAGQTDDRRYELAALALPSGQSGNQTDCQPYRIPAWAYHQVDLDPARWPRVVGGITFYRHGPEGPTAKEYCPSEVKMTGAGTGFTVLGQAGPGDSEILYFVNTSQGQQIFQRDFDKRAKEKTDARAYSDFMSRIFYDQPDYRVTKSDARLKRAARDQLVLRQQVHARVQFGEYLVTGVTLFHPVTEGRTALFAIPAVVTPRRSTVATTAIDVAGTLFPHLKNASVRGQ